mgnify:CR=1 FL=1
MGGVRAAGKNLASYGTLCCSRRTLYFVTDCCLLTRACRIRPTIPVYSCCPLAVLLPLRRRHANAATATAAAAASAAGACDLQARVRGSETHWRKQEAR